MADLAVTSRPLILAASRANVRSKAATSTRKRLCGWSLRVEIEDTLSSAPHLYPQAQTRADPRRIVRVHDVQRGNGERTGLQVVGFYQAAAHVQRGGGASENAVGRVARREGGWGGGRSRPLTASSHRTRSGAWATTWSVSRPPIDPVVGPFEIAHRVKLKYAAADRGLFLDIRLLSGGQSVA